MAPASRTIRHVRAMGTAGKGKYYDFAARPLAGLAEAIEAREGSGRLAPGPDGARTPQAHPRSAHRIHGHRSPSVLLTRAACPVARRGPDSCKPVRTRSA